MTTHATPVTPTTAELKDRARVLRAELPAAAAEADAANTDSGHGMRRLWEEGFFAYHLPRRYGGTSDADPTSGTEDFVAMLVDIMAGDSSTGMNYVVQSLVSNEIFDPACDLPESTREEMARRVRDDGVRLVASNAETGNRTGPVTGRRDGGGVVVTGTKTFNTNSGGGGWANVRFAMDGEDGAWHALVPLDGPGVRCRHDWDVMGQRGTHSQTIDYDGVVVPEGYFYRGNLSSTLATYVFLMHSAIMLGPGLGAFDAAVDYLRTLDRPSLPEFASAGEDPLIRRRIGEFAVSLQAARAYLLRCARGLEDRETTYGSTTEATIDAFAAKVACVRASLDVTSGIFDLTGARSTSNRYRFDRFWRNARTFATHDPTDAKEVWVGDWYLSGKEPPITAMLRV